MDYGNLSSDSSRMPNGVKAGGNEYTDDILLEMLSEPHRSNVRALKTKTKRLAF